MCKDVSQTGSVILARIGFEIQYQNHNNLYRVFNYLLNSRQSSYLQQVIKTG